MKVNISPERILHFIALTISTYLIGKLLITKLDWTPLSAYGLGCTIVVQVNNAILKISEADPSDSGDGGNDAKIGRERTLERRRRKAESTSDGVNRKKK